MRDWIQLVTKFAKQIEDIEIEMSERIELMDPRDETLKAALDEVVERLDWAVCSLKVAANDLRHE